MSATSATRLVLSVCVAIGGCAIIMIGLSLSTRQLTLRSRTPAQLLPHGEVAALFHHPDGEELKRWSTVFPLLSSVSASVRPKAVAVLSGATGSSVVMFFETPTAQGAKPIDSMSGGSITEIAPFTIVASDASVPRRMGLEREPLAVFEPYVVLAGVYGQDAPWVYLRIGSGAAIPADGSRALLTSPMLAKGDYAGASNTVQPTLAVMTGDSSHSAIARPGIGTRLPGSSIVIEAVDTTAFMQDLARERLSQSQKETAKSLLQTFVLAMTGNDVSFEHDVLPLLNNAAIELKPIEDGKVLFAISGKADDDETLRRTVDRLHASLRARASAANIEERLFDDRFSYRAIGGAHREGASTQITQGKWSVTVTRLGESLLVSAVDGNRFVLSNAEETIGALQNDESLTFLERNSMGASSVIAGGRMADAQLRSILAAMPGADEGIMPPRDAEPFEWTIRREGPLLLLLTQKASSFPLATRIDER